jgi:medium-chain acyl-[acyl-carrier-protein] hydrolase
MTVDFKSNAWIKCLRPVPLARFRLFCFPCAGASAGSYHGWAEELPADVEAFGVQLPGRGGRINEPPAGNLARLVQEITNAADPLLAQPFVFFGHSLGALISFEVARELRRRAAPQPRHLFVAARRAPQIPHRGRLLHLIPHDEFLTELRTFGGTPREILDNEDLLDMLLPALRTDFALHETYRYTDEPALDCPITVSGGVDDERVEREFLEPWREQTTGGFGLHMFGGGHFFVHDERRNLVRMMMEKLERLPGRSCAETQSSSSAAIS